jgi:hypothetical protein
MALLTGIRIKKPARQGWLAAVLLAIFLQFTVRAIWHSTTKLESRPVDMNAPMAQGLAVSESPADHPALTASDQSQTRAAQNGGFTPFLDIVPSQDGTELFISAGGVGELGGTVFANIGIGPGHDKGGYTMTYSGTIQSYITTAPGFTPEVDTYGPLSITTTLGLNTGEVEFNRAYVPASTTETINSIDGSLQLALVSTDTFPSEAYVVVVPSYAPPGPPPLGHRLVGCAYSVRASGARLVADRPMDLRLFYNETTLAGADRHTLAIFVWDVFNKHWDNLGGRLSYDQIDSTRNYLSVVTPHFGTYALMATPTWRDEFWDYEGLSAWSDVTLRSTGGDFELALNSDKTSGWAISDPITPTTPFEAWHSLAFTASIPSPTTTLRVDLLAPDNTPVLTGVTSGADLSSLDAASYPTLKLRANLASTAAGETPALDEWRLTWQVAMHRTYLPVVLK